MAVVGGSDVRSRFSGLLREFAVLGLAGLVAGFLVAGVVGRLVMRLQAVVASEDAIGRMTEGGNIVGDVTLDGTVAFLIFVGVGFGAFGAVTMVAIWPWLSRWSTHIQSLVLGLFVLAVGGAGVIEADNADFPIVGNEWLAVLLFAGLFILWGYTAVWLQRVFDRRFASESRPWTRIYGALTVIGIVLYLGLPTTLFDETSKTPAVVAVSVVVLYLTAIGIWSLRIWPRNTTVKRVLRTVGYTAIAVTLTFGLAHTASEAVNILS